MVIHFCLEEYTLLLTVLSNDPAGSDTSDGKGNKTLKGHTEPNPAGIYHGDLDYT